MTKKAIVEKIGFIVSVVELYANWDAIIKIANVDLRKRHFYVPRR